MVTDLTSEAVLLSATYTVLTVCRCRQMLVSYTTHHCQLHSFILM